MPLDPTPCLTCDQPYYDCKGVKAASSCVFYYADNGGSSLLTGLNLPNGTSLTKILEKIDIKLTAKLALNVSSFNLGNIKNEYIISDLQSLVEALADKANKQTISVAALTAAQTTLIANVTSIQNFLTTPALNTLYSIGITNNDSLKTIVEKIVNAIGVLQNSGVGGGSGSSPNVTAINTPTIAITASGSQGHTISANAIVSNESGNILQAKSTGLYAAEVPQVLSYDSNTRVIALSRSGGSITLPAPPTIPAETQITPLTTPTVTMSATGTAKHTISAEVNINAILDQTLQSPSLRSKFCQICENTDPCAGGNAVAIWVDTGETRCKELSFTLEKRQKDTNLCSVTYNTFRWITAEVNSLACGYGSIQYCIEYNCGTSGCNGCVSVRACIKDQFGNNAAAPANAVFTYDYTVDGITTQKTFTIAQGQSAGEICHCDCASGSLCSISNVQAPSGYAICTGSPQPPVISPIPPSGGISAKTLTVNQPFTYTVPVWQNTVSYSMINLPVGLSFNPTTRVVSGTPTTVENKEALLTGTGSTGLTTTISVLFDVKAAPVYKYLNSVYIDRDSTGTELTINGEGGTEGIEIQFGADAAYLPATKTANTVYKRKFFGTANGTYQTRVRLVGTTTYIEFNVVLTTTPQTGKVFPGTNNIMPGKSIIASSGDNVGNINDGNTATDFTTESQTSPAIRVDIRNTQGTRPFVNSLSIVPATTPDDWRGFYIIFSPNGTLSATNTFNQNANVTGALVKRVPLDEASDPIIIDLDDLQYADMLIQRADSGVISVSEIELYGSYPIVNTPPSALAAIPDITKTENNALSYDVKDKFTDAEGDTLTYTAQLLGGFALPSWLTFTNGVFTATSIPWEGGEGVTSFQYRIRVTVQDTSGAATTSDFNFYVQKAGTLETLENLQFNLDHGNLSIFALVSSGPLETRLVGVSQSYGDSNWKTMTNNQPYTVIKPYNRIYNYYPNVLVGTYKIEVRVQEGGTIFSRTVTFTDNMGKVVVYEKAATTTPTINGISYTFDNNGKPVIDAIATGAVEIQIVQISGSGWTETGWVAGTLVNGATGYRRSYTTVPPSGSYRYDVRLVSNNASLQSGSFVLGGTAEDYFLQVDWKNTSNITIRVQTATQSGTEWKFATESTWTNATNSSNNLPEYTNDPVIAGAFKYTFTIPTSASTRVLQLRKTGTNLVLNVTVPVGNAPIDGTNVPIYGGNFLVKQGVWEWDAGNLSSTARFVQSNAADTLQIAYELANASTTLSGSNFGSATDSGPWTNKTGSALNWFDFIPWTSVSPYTIRRRFEKGSDGGATGTPSQPIKIYIRKKNTTSPIQTITHTPTSNTAGSILNITAPASGTGGGGGVTPTDPTNRLRMVGVRDHGINLATTGSGSDDVADMQTYYTGFKAVGGSAAQFTHLRGDTWSSLPLNKAGSIALINKMVQLGLTPAIHFCPFYKNTERPAWLTDDLCQRWGIGGGLVVFDDNASMPSLALLEGWKNRVATPSGWTNANPWWRWCYEEVVPVLQYYGSSLKEVSFCSQKTLESGYSTADTDGVLDNISGYEQLEKDSFKVKAIEWSGGTLAGFNSRFGTSYTNISQLNMQPVKTGDSLKTTFNGTGIGFATYLYRTYRIRLFQEFCEWMVRTAAGSSAKIGAEYGTTFGQQASLYAATHPITNAATADYFRENLITGYADQRNWEMGANRLWSIAPNKNFRSDLDGSLYDGDFKPAYGTTNTLTLAQVYNKVSKYIILGGDLVFFAFRSNTPRSGGRPSSRAACYNLTQQLTNNGLTGTQHATIYPSENLTYNTSIFRNGDNGGNLYNQWDALAQNGKSVKFNINEEIWPP